MDDASAQFTCPLTGSNCSAFLDCDTCKTADPACTMTPVGYGLHVCGACLPSVIAITVVHPVVSEVPACAVLNARSLPPAGRCESALTPTRPQDHSGVLEQREDPVPLAGDCAEGPTSANLIVAMLPNSR